MKSVLFIFLVGMVMVLEVWWVGCGSDDIATGDLTTIQQPFTWDDCSDAFDECSDAADDIAGECFGSGNYKTTYICDWPIVGGVRCVYKKDNTGCVESRDIFSRNEVYGTCHWRLHYEDDPCDNSWCDLCDCESSMWEYSDQYWMCSGSGSGGN